MKLLEYYARYFEEYGDFKSVMHPFWESVIKTNSPCFFSRVCSSDDTNLVMSSRKGDQMYHVCKSCLKNYLLSWNQPNMVEYHKCSTGVDLDAEIPDIDDGYIPYDNNRVKYLNHINENGDTLIVASINTSQWGNRDNS